MESVRIGAPSGAPVDWLSGCTRNWGSSTDGPGIAGALEHGVGALPWTRAFFAELSQVWFIGTGPVARMNRPKRPLSWLVSVSIAGGPARRPGRC